MLKYLFLMSTLDSLQEFPPSPQRSILLESEQIKMSPLFEKHVFKVCEDGFLSHIFKGEDHMDGLKMLNF